MLSGELINNSLELVLAPARDGPFQICGAVFCYIFCSELSRVPEHILARDSSGGVMISNHPVAPSTTSSYGLEFWAIEVIFGRIFY